MDIEIPDFEDLPFEQRCKARCEYVDVKAAEFKLLFLRAIIKMEFDYHIELIVRSTLQFKKLKTS